MKKNIIIAILASVLLCISQFASAVPAKPGLITYTQPDGSKISIRIHGDEWFHYITDEKGSILEENAAGYLVKSSATIATLQPQMAKARAAKQNFRAVAQSTILKAQVKGTPKIPVFLVQFQDKSFSISDPKTAFSNLLSEEGYSDNGATGSVLDYYSDQSRGKYTPQFDVMDVVTLTGNISTYGSDDENAAKAIYEACQQLDSSVDFSQYDNDGDGYIDMVLMYYAGYNEAEGGPAETIWPHQYYVPIVVKDAKAFDGVMLYRYFCTSELKNASGTKMCGIGTTCHEFAHSLGLPDFYDTNYDYYGDGECGATYYYDVMCSGSYNNGGCTPPWMSAEELVMLGWMDSITEITTEREVTVPSIDASTPVAYKTPATDDGEYFLYECRPGTGWDAPLDAGLLVYHVDKAQSHSITWNLSSSSTYTLSAYYLWAQWESYNSINCNASHPCYYIVPAGDQSNLNYSGSNFTFPGSSNVTTFIPEDWEGNDTGFAASDISYDSTTKSVTFTLVNTNAAGITGYVRDSDGNPIAGATITAEKAAITPVASSGNGVFTISKIGSVNKTGPSALLSATTEENGSYSLSLDESGTYIVTATKDGYQSKSVTIDIDHLKTQNFYLLKEGESNPSEIKTYPDSTTWYSYTYGTSSIMCADIFPSKIMGAHAGKQIKSISFTVAGTTDDSGASTTTGDVYALLDIGSERKVALKVDDPVINDWTTVDVSDLGLIIPEGKDIYAGYALNSWSYSHPCVGTTVVKSSELIGYAAYFDLSSTAWNRSNIVFRIKLTIGDYEAPETGYNYIEYDSTGDKEFKFKLVTTASDKRPDDKGVTWYYDDEPLSGTTAPMGADGTHIVRAEFTDVAGNKKVIELEINFATVM